ncbi:MAG: ABC transporter permease subunit [Bacteroidetes bacterium]|jgi:polar amino acid transport system permease protein|nr:amino acid ABC transporter permease [Alphaproteobacteria bacterium]NCF48438.1 ABC transporter permease subunit [Bacteroidota bacterium]
MAHNKSKLKIVPLDFVVMAAVVMFVFYVIHRVNSVLIYNWDWSVIPGYLFRWDEETSRYLPNLLIKGLITTIRISVWALILSSIIGILLGVARTSKRLLPRLVGWLYVEFIRNIPPVPFLFLFYFFISSQIIPHLGIRDALEGLAPGTRESIEFFIGPSNLVENFISGVISLALMSAAYIAEIVRAGIQSIPKGQTEAGRTVGLSRLKILRYVILPQAIQRVLPPLAGQFITLIKDSSLVALISIQELSFLAMEIAISEQRFFEVWISVGLMYFTVCFACSLVFSKLEKRGAVR